MMKYLLRANLLFYQSPAHCTEKKARTVQQQQQSIHGQHTGRYNLHLTH